MTKHCEWCGKEMIKPPHLSTKIFNKSRYCSHKCFGVASSNAPNNLINDPQLVEQVIKAYILGHGAYFIAAKYNISNTTVYKILKKHGVAIRPVSQNRRRPPIKRD